MGSPAMAVLTPVENDILEAIEKINKLNAFLVENNRLDDLIKAAADREYQKQLIEELDIK